MNAVTRENPRTPFRESRARNHAAAGSTACRFVAVLLLGYWLPGGAHAVTSPDIGREQRLASEIQDAILEGDVTYLTGDAGHRFLAIQTPAVAQPAKGTVVLLHGRGLHPDWANVMHPLRVGLSERGWDTLAIQLPVLDKSALYYDYVAIFDGAIPRIEAALGLARQSPSGPVVLLAHSCGAHMAHHWMARGGPAALSRFDAYIGIGMGATDAGQPMREPFVFEQMHMPILDLYGANDYSAVRRMAKARRAGMARGGNPKNAQVVVPDSDHNFVDRGPALLDVVANWLDTL